MIQIFEVQTFFVLLFENNAHGTRHTGYFIPTVEIKNYNIKIHGKNFFD